MPDKRKESLPGDKPSNKKHKGDSDNETHLSYDPVHFIRSHSKNNDPADIQTQASELTASYYSDQITLISLSDLGSCVRARSQRPFQDHFQGCYVRRQLHLYN